MVSISNTSYEQAKSLKSELHQNTDKLINLNEGTGVWSFKCRHVHNRINNPLYNVNVHKRDKWIDNKHETYSDGC